MELIKLTRFLYFLGEKFIMQHIRADLHSFEPDFKALVPVSGSRVFWCFKRFFDLVVCIFLLPGLLVQCLVALVLNLFFNKGPLFFVQTRMGRNCRPFQVIKFRSMTTTREAGRGHDEPIEVDRITRLGGFLRKTGLDEVPQILNVLRGDMSLIGPRPDYYEHAQNYSALIPGYKARYQVRPGISGLAQVSLGYAEGIEATRQKTHADQYYIAHASLRLDTKIALKTLSIVATRSGA